MTNTINFTATGDTTSQAIQKFINEFNNEVYPDLNSIRQCYIGSTAPASPEAGMPWINTTNAATTGAVFTMRDYLNANWIPILTIASNAIPAVANPVQGDIMYYAGDSDTEKWQLLAPGTLGQFLQTQGGSANPRWLNIPMTFGSLHQFKAQVTSSSSISISTANNPFTGSASSGINLTLSSGGTGANSLDTGVVAASTWYYHYIIFGANGTASLLSLSATSPTMPSGYNQYIRTGAVRTDSNSSLVYTIQSGKKVRLIVTQKVRNDDAIRLISSGAQGSWSNNNSTFAAVSIDSFIPQTAGIINLTLAAIGQNNTGISVAPNSNYNGSYSTYSGSAYYPPPLASAIDLNFSTTSGELVLESRNIYVASQSSGQVFLTGWEDNL